MIEPAKHVEALQKELESVRGLQSQAQQPLHRCAFLVFVLASTSVAVMGITDVFKDPELTALCTFGLSQLILFLLLVALALLSHVVVQSGHLHAIEDALNDAAGKNVALWDSYSADNLFGRPFSVIIPTVLATALVVGAAGYLFLQDADLRHTQLDWPAVFGWPLVLFEFLVGAGIMLCIRPHRAHVYRMARKAYGLPPLPDQPPVDKAPPSKPATS